MSRAVRALAVVFGLAFAAATVRFALAKPGNEVVMPVLDRHPAGVHDVAFYRYGPRVVVSSTMFEATHHASYLVDGEPTPPHFAKWVSATGDAAPFAEIHFRQTHAIERIVVALAGTREHPMFDLRRAHARCLGTSGRPYGERRTVEAKNSYFVFPLRCRARGVRLDFEIVHDGIADVTRVFEVEVFGR